MKLFGMKLYSAPVGLWEFPSGLWGFPSGPGGLWCFRWGFGVPVGLRSRFVRSVPVSFVGSVDWFPGAQEVRRTHTNLY